MNKIHILLPMLAMFALVVMVSVTMLRRRIAFYKSNRVHPQKTALSAQMAAVMPDSRAPDNFRNLFELPVMFYAALIMLYVTNLASPLHVALAWGYVAARYAHSFVHCTTNVVMHRFYAFVTSCALLLILWAVMGWQLIQLA
jgi:hypothetical protein